MGFRRLTPENAVATRVAGVRTFLLGGAVIFLAGAAGTAFAAFGLWPFAWEQVALMIIGAVVVSVGFVIGLVTPQKRSRR